MDNFAIPRRSPSVCWPTFSTDEFLFFCYTVILNKTQLSRKWFRQSWMGSKKAFPCWNRMTINGVAPLMNPTGPDTLARSLASVRAHWTERNVLAIATLSLIPVAWVWMQGGLTGKWFDECRAICFPVLCAAGFACSPSSTGQFYARLVLGRFVHRGWGIDLFVENAPDGRRCQI